jgi:acetyltransferase-like isoleucine patch superfamily enzyme
MREFSLPAPRPLVVPIVAVFLTCRSLFFWLFRIFIAEPFLKAQCKSYGRRVRAGNFIHYISGEGDIRLGDEVHLDGKSDFIFASILDRRPALFIGDRTYVNHGCTFIVADRISIGRNVLIANGVTLSDSPGHPLDAEARVAGLPPSPEQIKPITIHDKVWIGAGARVFPGVIVGEGAVIGAGAVVVSEIPAYTLAIGVPARPVRALSQSQLRS